VTKVRITFDATEWDRAEVIATKKLEASEARGFRPKHGAYQNRQHRYQTNLYGVMGELAVEKHFGLSLRDDHENPDGPADIGGVQVRSSFKSSGALFIYKYDEDDRIHVHCTSNVYRRFVMITGWIWGRDGKQACFWNTQLNDPCYAVPQSSLRPMDLLMAMDGEIVEVTN
jgi:hypothetical protein